MICRRGLCWLALLLLTASAAVVRAQSFDLDRDRERVVSLDGLWRFHTGDDPRWAAPGFDDSDWKLLRSDRSWSTQGYRDLSGYGWYRFSVRVPAGTESAFLLLPPIMTGYEVYVDGQRAGGAGPAEPRLLFTIRQTEYNSVRLTGTRSEASRTVSVAIRVWHSPIWSSYMGGGPVHGGGLVGNERLVAAEQHDSQLRVNVRYVDLYLSAFIRLMMGLTILGLFFLRTGEREYLWFALIQLFGGADDVLNYLEPAYSVLPLQIADLLDGALSAGFWITGLYFFATVLGGRRSLQWRVALVLAFISPLATIFYWFGWLSVPVSGSVETLLVLPSLIWVLWFLTVRAVRGDTDARLLILPTLLVHGFYLAFNVAITLSQLGLWPDAPDLLNLRLKLMPFDLGIYTIFNILFLLAMLAFLIRRFSLARKQEERLAGEMEAAREVQQLLLPEISQVAGFAVECIYLPAESVGGDFFQQIPDGEGGLLLVVGDVAGKGLPAAMMVSMLVGAIHSEARHGIDPAALLSSLNERMLARSRNSFATGLAAHLRPDGRLTLANAGHLPPYLDGMALDLPGSLPLGMLAGCEYEAFEFRLRPGDRLTFLSDGVVEAQGATGELFGFERTGEVSRGSAQAIARAAQLFGQEDDITVVTVEFVGVSNLLAAPSVTHT